MEEYRQKFQELLRQLFQFDCADLDFGIYRIMDIFAQRLEVEELQQSLLERDVVLGVELNPNLHDREIRLDNGWVIKIGRGLDFYQRPNSWFEIGVNDLSLRKCLETKVDIFRA